MPPSAHINGSPASQRSTPSRSTPNGSRRVNGYHSPFRHSYQGSPSRQVLEDYSKVYASKERALKRSLDDQTTEQAAKHFKALDDSLLEHQRVRESAERTLEYIRLENEREQRRTAELEAQRIEDARRRLEQQKADEQRRRVEEERARQDELRRQEELRKQQEEQARQRAAAQQQHERDEAARREQRQKEESDRKAREEAEAKQREQQAQKEREAAAQRDAASAQQSKGVSAPAPATQPSGERLAQTSAHPPGFVTPPNELEAMHQRYMALHKRLKTMRDKVSAEVKRLGPGQKNQLTEWRQSINGLVGRMDKRGNEEARANNRKNIKAIQDQLDAATRTTEPMIDITEYLVDNRQPPGAPTTGPAQLLFLLNHFAKSVIRQIIAETGNDAAYGNAHGILLVTIFARPNYLFNGQSLIDVFWAKYHKRCPVLFGISGDEKTKEGRFRIGWHRNGEVLSPADYYIGVRGLGVGFANVTLRSFANSANQNPAPNHIFWQAFARVLNTPIAEVQPTHVELVKAIVEFVAPKMTSTYGSGGLALIRHAVTVFPTKHESAASLQGTLAKSAVTALKSLPHILQQNFGIQL